MPGKQTAQRKFQASVNLDEFLPLSASLSNPLIGCPHPITITTAFFFSEHLLYITSETKVLPVHTSLSTQQSYQEDHPGVAERIMRPTRGLGPAHSACCQGAGSCPRAGGIQAPCQLVAGQNLPPWWRLLAGRSCWQLASLWEPGGCSLSAKLESSCSFASNSGIWNMLWAAGARQEGLRTWGEGQTVATRDTFSLVSSSTLAPHPHPLQACWVSWPWQRGPGTFNLPWGESGCCGASPGSYPGRSPTRAAAAVGDRHTGLTPSSIEAPDPVPACLPVVARTPCLSCSGNGNCHRPGPISSRNESRVGPGGGAASTRAHLRCPTFPGRPLPSSSSSSVPPHPPRYPDPDLLTPWACVGAGEGVSGVPMWNLEARFRPLRGPGFPHCQVGMMRHLPPGAKYTLCKQC